jgi:hypothetical protein
MCTTAVDPIIGLYSYGSLLLLSQYIEKPIDLQFLLIGETAGVEFGLDERIEFVEVAISEVPGFSVKAPRGAF